MTDLLGGQVDFMCDQTTNTTGQIQGGEVKAYAVTSPERLANLPDLPTTAEAGLPDFQLGVWHGLYAPAGTPPEVLAKLNEALKTAVADPNVVERFAELGTAPAAPEEVTPEALGAAARRPDRALEAADRGGGGHGAVAPRCDARRPQGHPGRADLPRLRRSPSATPPPATSSAPRSAWGRATSRWCSPASSRSSASRSSPRA